MTRKVYGLWKEAFSFGLAVLLLLILIQSAAASSSQAGDPENGKALFIDNVRLENGGPPCISCHSIDDVGFLGGGKVGPDLSSATAIYGDEGLISALADITFPTMKPIFASHPLTENEQADLAAYISSKADHPQHNKVAYILALSVGGFLAALAVGAFYWRGRQRGVRANLVSQAKNTKGNP